MIDLDAIWMKAHLDAVDARITHAAEVLDWAHGKQTLLYEDIIPNMPSDPTAKAQAMKDFERYKRRVQSLGPRILKTKRAGAVGDVNWGGDNQGGIDKRLEALDLRNLARTAFDPLVANGVTAAWAFTDERTGRNKIQVLGGYIELIYHEDDPQGEPIGLLQITQDPGQLKVRYRVRVYDIEARSIREWRNLEKPTDLGGPPSDTWENTSVPRVALYDADQAGEATGEISQALELLRDEVASQVSIKRVSDAHAFPLQWQAGNWDRVEEQGATTVLESPDPEAKVGRLDPGEMEQLFIQQDRAMERLRGDLSLPIASIGGGTWPSGEALQQANVAYVTSSQDYAYMLSRLLTEVVGDYAELENISDPPPVTVSVNREQMRTVISQQVREDFRAGVISLRMAVTALAPYYPASSSEEIEEHITREESPLAVDEELPATPVAGEE